MCQNVMAALGRTYYFCMGFRVVVKGKQVGSSEAPILAVAPHSTFFDGIVCIVAGLPSTVSRVENLATPIFGSETLLHCFAVVIQEWRSLFVLGLLSCWCVVPLFSHLLCIFMMSCRVIICPTLPIGYHLVQCLRAPTDCGTYSKHLLIFSRIS